MSEIDFKAVSKRLERVEKELELLKALIWAKRSSLTTPSLQSFRGMAKLLVPEEDLDKSIEEVKRSIFKLEGWKDPV